MSVIPLEIIKPEYSLKFEELQTEVINLLGKNLTQPKLSNIILNTSSKKLNDSVNYSLTGGKKIRAFLVAITALAYNISSKDILPYMKSVEYIHTASLIIDDIQDEDKERRKKLSTNIKYGLNTALLTAFGLINESYQEISKLCADNRFKSYCVTKLLKYFSTRAGLEKICLGQQADLDSAKNDLKLNEISIKEIYKLKTSSFIDICVVPVAMLAGADEKEIKILEEFTYHTGIALQIHNDLKKSGQESDEKNNTKTIVSLLGSEKATQHKDNHLKEALESLENFPYDTSLLEEFITILK